MDIEELNRQMSFFQNDYTYNQSEQTHSSQNNSSQNNSSQNNSSQNNSSQNQSINFPSPLETPMPTTQIKRPTRTTGTHRNEINDKMAQMKMNQPMMMAPNQFQTTIPIPALAQHTRNNSQYQNQANPDTSIANKQHIENIPHLLDKHYQQEQENPLSAYFQQNYSTFNGIHNSNQQPIKTSLEQFNIPTNMQQHSLDRDKTHSGGQPFINPNNFTSFTQSPIQSLSQQQQPGTGYHRMDEKRIDYRQNMNSKVGDFIFDNPNAARYNPQQVAYNPINGYARDTRMVIQDSSKDIYRQEANSRMAQYSPLARASHVPCNIANMSVNDFYANMNPTNQSNQQYQTVEEDARAVLNARMGAYTPLAKVAPLEKPKTWQDNNVNQANPLVAHDELPIISH